MPIEISKVIHAKNQHESKLHGTLLFPCACYFSDINDYLTGDIPWHWHMEVEAIVVVNGSMKLNLNGVTYILKKGEGAFINTNVLHSMEIEGDNGCILNSFVFHPSLISASEESVFWHRYIRPLLECHKLPVVTFYSEIQWHCESLKCIEEAYYAYSKEEFGYELIVREKLSHMWYLIIKNMESSLLQQNQHEDQNIIRVKVMLDFIHNHYSQQLSLNEIASLVNISERECLRCFQRNIGITPIQYLLKYRISLAASLLENTNIPITEICTKVGFDNPSYFSKIFKRFMHITPSEYRKKHIKEFHIKEKH